MDHKVTTWKAIMAVVVGGITAYMQMIIVPLVMLLCVVIIDYITGMMRAWVATELSSARGRRGIIKKVGYFVLIVVGGVVDWLIYSGLTKIGIKLEFSFCFGLIVCIWLIINELISILENLTALEVPMPGFLKAFVKHLKVTVETKGETEVSESEVKK
ncbi:MAG: phage holin family protein [Ruminococcus sp.]|nr:phage holin family protein [Ruminococcus sp.]